MIAPLFQPEDGGVSPVIGTILMVAIVTVIAAVLFIVVSGINSTSQHPDYVSFVLDDLNDQLRVTKFEGDPSWSEFEIQASVNGDFDYMGRVGAGADAMVAGQFVAIGGNPNGPPDAPVAAWMSLSLCAEPAASDVYITIRHVDPNSIVFRGRFSSLRDCEP